MGQDKSGFPVTNSNNISFKRGNTSSSPCKQKGKSPEGKTKMTAIPQAEDTKPDLTDRETVFTTRRSSCPTRVGFAPATPTIQETVTPLCLEEEEPTLPGHIRRRSSMGSIGQLELPRLSAATPGEDYSPRHGKRAMRRSFNVFFSQVL